MILSGNLRQVRDTSEGGESPTCCGFENRHEESSPAQNLSNNVHSDKFESHLDDFFTSKTKVKDHGRKCSIKIFGQWT